MGEVSTIGLDIAKSVFQVHGVDSGGAVVSQDAVHTGVQSGHPHPRTSLKHMPELLVPSVVGTQGVSKEFLCTKNEVEP